MLISIQRSLIRCYDQKEYDELMVLLSENGFYWGTARRQPTMDNNWPAYQAETFISLESKNLTFGKRRHFGTNPGYILFDAREFIRVCRAADKKTISCPDCKDTKQYHGLFTIEPCKTCCIPQSN